MIRIIDHPVSGNPKGFPIMKGMVALAAFLLSFVVGCKSDLERGIEAINKGDRRNGLEYLKRVEKDDKSFTQATDLIQKVTDTLMLERADSNYLGGNYQEAKRFYEEISSADSTSSLRIMVCNEILEFEKRTDPIQRYVWLSRYAFHQNKAVYRGRSIKTGTPIITKKDADTTSDCFVTMLDFLAGSKQPKINLIGQRIQAACFPWGDFDFHLWHGGYYWNNESFVIMIRYEWTAYGGFHWDSYATSDVEIPKRQIQNFLVEYVGEQQWKDEYDRVTKYSTFQIVACLGFNSWHHDDLILTTTHLRGYFERALANEKGISIQK